MIRLRDILLETPADDAKRMGLVSKPGFGLYGPPGEDKPATHRTRLGKLVQIQQDDQPKQTSQKTDAPDKPTQQGNQQATDKKSEKPKQQSVTHPTSPIGRTRVYEASGLAEISSAVGNTFDGNGRITNLNTSMGVVSKGLGRETLVPIQTGGTILRASQDFHGSADAVLGVYSPEEDRIEMSETTPDFMSTPVSEWDDEQILGFKTYTHEVIHSTSPRLRGSRAADVYNNPLNVTIEEGLTEYLAQGVVIGTLESRNPRAHNVNGGGYSDYVDGVEFMVRYGDLNAGQAFRNSNVETLRMQVNYTQSKAINNTLSEAGIGDTDTFDKIRVLQQRYWQNGFMLIMDEKFAKVMFYIRQEIEAGRPVSKEEIDKMLKDYLEQV